MKRITLTNLVFGMLLCLPGYAQTDSVQHLSNTAPLAADSASAAVAGQQSVTPAQASMVDPAIGPENKQAKSTDAVIRSGYSIYWLVGCGVLGILLGGFGYRLLGKASSTDGKTDASQNGDLPVNNQLDDGGFVKQWSLEQEHARLVDLSNTLMVENDQLKQDKNDLEAQLNSANRLSGMSDMDTVQEIVFYMPQPDKNGRFQEASKRTEADDALYVFHIARDDQSNATFEFIAKDAFLNAAIGNEPSWISIACDRTNQPSATTTRVKTESPGLASLKDGEWEITRKAKITYL